MEYASLPNDRSVRLLEILPRADEYDVSCRLEAYLLADRPVYEALSYVWGAPIFDHIIVCNDHTFYVTQSLYDVLVLLQRSDSRRLFWIDQICINQDNITERAQQVRLMGDIYRQAASVVCSLGAADGDTETVWRFFSSLQQTHGSAPLHLYESMATELASGDSHGDAHLLRVVRPSLPSTTSNDWKAVQNFLLRPWFTRCWTCQEALLGRICMLQCGAFEMAFDSLYESVKILNAAGYGNLVGKGRHNVSTIGLQRAFLKNHWNRPELASMLSMTRTRKATDPRDKIYAFLGVIHTSTAKLITANYSLSVDRVYAIATRACIQGPESLEVFTHVEVRRYDNHTLPSWVPDWRSLESTQVALGSKRRNGTQYFSTTGSLKPLLLQTHDWRKLGLKGFLLAPITSFRDVKTALQLHDPCISNNTLNAGRWSTRTWIQMYRSAVDILHIPNSCVKQPEVIDVFTNHDVGITMGDPPPFQLQLETAFRRTITADLHPLSASRHADEDQYAAYYRWQRQSFSKVFPPQVLLEHDKHVSNLMFQREFFIAGTEPDCYMGVALGTLREGDWVCMLARGDTPYVLRPQRKITDQDVADVEEWEFVHDCYVHGVMYGETLQGLQDPSFRWKNFVLV